MKFRVRKSGLSSNSPRNRPKTIQLCPPMRKQLVDVAIRRVGGDMLKLFLTVKTQDLIQERNRMDIPHGLFGLKLENFYERRKMDTVYLDVLKMVCKEALQQAKMCIVLDDLRDLIKKLIAGYNSDNMGPIINDITDSGKLLTIHETIAESFLHNTAKLQVIGKVLSEFNLRRRTVLSRLDSEIYGAQNRYMESILVLNKLEYRTYLNFQKQVDAQHLYELNAAEEQFRNSLDRIRSTHGKEELVSDWILLRQNNEINYLKIRIAEMTKEYDHQTEMLDGRAAYNRNTMEIMRNRLIDCTARLDFFAVEMEKLIIWDGQREQREREEALAYITKSLQKKKKKKEKQKEKALADLSTAIDKQMEDMEKQQARKIEIIEKLK